MTYEGDYMELLTDDVPRTEKELMEMDNAVKAIKGWAFKDDEVWMRDTLVRILRGEAPYESFPWETRINDEHEEVTRI